MFDYTLSREYDVDVFFQYVKQFDKCLNMSKEPLLRDVDDTLIQIYRSGADKVVIKADATIDVTYVVSSVDLSHIVKKT